MQLIFWLPWWYSTDFVLWAGQDIIVNWKEMEQRKKLWLHFKITTAIWRHIDFLRDTNPKGEGRQAKGIPSDPSCAPTQRQRLLLRVTALFSSEAWILVLTLSLLIHRVNSGRFINLYFLGLNSGGALHFDLKINPQVSSQNHYELIKKDCVYSSH